MNKLRSLSSRFILSICLALLVLFSNAAIWADENLDFAEKLIENGYQSLGAKYYEKALNAGKVPSSKSDEVYLALFKILNQIAASTNDAKAKASLEKRATAYFEKIKDPNNPEVQLERVKSSMGTMKRANFNLGHPIEIPTPAQAKTYKAQVKKAFKLVSEVSDKIRLDSRAWLTNYEENMEEKEQKKNQKEYGRQRQLEINASLMFGEACVIYANALGHKDKEVREWLARMAKNYEEFISNNFGELPSVIGNIYLGEVFILLEKFKDDYGEVNGIERGIETFEDAIAGLAEYENEKRIADFINTWTITAYSKLANSLVTVGQSEKAVEAYVRFFDWSAPDKFSPKSGDLHDLSMNGLSEFCKLLLKLYNAGDKKKVNYLANYALAGFNFTKKTKSKWHNNFADLMGKLPANDPNIVETTDIAFLKAGQLFNKALGSPEKVQKDVYVEAAMKYKKAINLARIDGVKKLDEILPEASYKMGVCFSKADNHLLALITFLAAIEKYPSTKFSESTHPDIYKNIRGCAINARSSAGTRNKISGQRFDQGLYEKTLSMIAKLFPEEGGDPEYFIGDLKRRSGFYEESQRQYAKIPTSSKMYFKSQYYLVYSQYQLMRERVKKGVLKDDDLKKEKAELIEGFRKVIELCAQVTDKKKIKDEKKYKYIVESKIFATKASFQRLASLSYEEGDFKTAHSIYFDGLKSSKSNIDKHEALQDMITCSFKMADAKSLDAEIKQVEALKVGGTYPEGIKKKTLNNAYKMLGNLVIKQKMNVLIDQKNKASGEAVKEIDEKLKAVYKEVGDIFFAAVKAGVEKDETFLKQVIVYYFTSEMALENVLEAIQLYFEWYPKLPALELKHQEMLGKTPKDWDALLGGVEGSMNIDVVKSTYGKFMDALFDKSDYSSKRIKEIRTLKKEQADVPRNYNTAERILGELEKYTVKDRNFQKVGWPKLVALKEEIKLAKGYYNMLYMQADCYSRLNKYDDASEVYKKLSKYYVEQFDIRIELGKAMFAQGTAEGFGKAKEIFSELTAAVAKPGSSTYKPKDYFNLQFWSMRSKLKALGEKPPAADVIKAWKFFRSYIYMDIGYFAKEDSRFSVLKIPSMQKGSHIILIDQIKEWVAQNIFPVLKEDGGPLASDSWEKILGDK